MKASKAILAMLRAYDVTDVFGLPGETTLALYEAWEEYPEIKYHLTRDERNSVFMADAYAKATGRVGVCEGPSVGATHMVPGVVEAFQSCVPLIVITTDIDLKTGPKNMLTGFDQSALFKSIAKDSFTVTDASEIPHLFRRAFRTATTGRPGPVHIRIPMNTLEGEAADGEIYAQSRYSTFPGCRNSAAAADVTEAAALLAAARRPVMICGQGVVHSGAWKEAAALSKMQEMPVGSTINAKGCLNEHEPLSLGVIGARGGREWNNRMVKEADVILFAATSTDSANTDGWKLPSPNSGQKFIQIDIAERELGNNYDALPLFGDARETLTALTAALAERPRPDRGAWAARCAEEKAAHEKKLEAIMARCGDEPHPLSLVRAIERLTPDTAFFAVDPGSPAIYSSCFLRIARAGRRAAYNFSMGALGYAIPAAIGARCGTAAEAPVVGLIGDGSFGFCGAELETAARLGLKIIYVLFNNGTFGWIRGTQRVHTGAEITRNFRQFTDFAKVDYVKFAESLGLTGCRAGSMSEFEEIFAKCLKADGPCLIDVPLKPEDEQLPPVPAWAAAKIAKDEDMAY
ncbi:thiamine pyrophosphate-binding protein [Cloacibacillus evryensis]|uniref:thiamine pyrophosphate-binding protein n=1 Tax=Cloacibacillus evryensis TaxID=508460 RepID=UPI000446E4FB|nr:thiamine pyrophosphate-binding protein [Cloacibacillus evryensis]EXG78253.1 thiamine pyrophosphate-dependent enzyme, putative carboligase or decarboxylase [Cloacibacillus evryensis DSM 19522]MCQ4765326.1 thiamine pyrophosphate-binding protein [Cloacibacillus evryensis]